MVRLHRILWLAIGVAGCTSEVGEEPRPVREPFIALQHDFEGFLSWDRTEVEGVMLEGGHPTDGPTFVYVSEPLPSHEAPIDVGTILVKTVERGAQPEWEVHAMVKRGGDFNAAGSPGWEWFDLVFDGEGTPVITWRGEGSDADPGGYVRVTEDGEERLGCNDCHGLIGRKDHVFSRAHLPVR